MDAGVEAESDAPADFAVVQVYGDGRPVIVACLRCDWQSGKGTRAYLLGPNGPARQHDRDKHPREHGHWCSDACAASDEHMAAMDRDAWQQIADDESGDPSPDL